VKLFAGQNDPEDQRLVGDWVAKGLAFWLNEEGLAKLHTSEKRRMEIEPQQIHEWTGSGQYINFGTNRYNLQLRSLTRRTALLIQPFLSAHSDPVYMEKTQYDSMVLSGVLRKGEQDQAFVRKLVEDGQAFDDLEHVSGNFHVLALYEHIKSDPCAPTFCD